MNVVEINNLTKEYKGGFKLGPIDLKIVSGRIIGLIGENGAGKTTMIKSILNIINSTSGSIKIFDKEYDDNLKEDIGVVLDNTFFPEIITAKDIDFSMKDIFKSWDSKYFYKLLKDFDLKDNVKIKTLSKGMRKKLEIATALAHHPKLLILDEPTSGLDPVVRSEVLELFNDFVGDGEHTIMLSTHITSDLEHLADDIVFIDDGKILLNQSREDVMNKYGVIRCKEEIFNKIDKEDIISYKKTRDGFEVLIADKDRLANKYEELQIEKITLDELMVLLIKGVK